jgi:hypothetical protein
MQQLLMTMAHLFLRLSKVRIFPKAANHVKKAALEEAIARQKLFHGKPLPSTLAKVRKKALS